MAAKNAELRASIGTTFDGTDQLVYVRSHWNILDGIPSTFTPTAHSHDGSVRYVVGNTTGTAGYWTGTIADITAMYDGLVVAYKIGIAGAGSTYLNINGYGNILVRRDTGNLTTHLPVGTVVILTYDGTYWVWADYDSDDVYSLRNSYYDLVGADPMYQYKIMFEGSDGALYPLTLDNGTGLTKVVSTRNLKIGGMIKAYVTSATVAANTLTRYYMAESVSLDALYTLNSSSGFVAGKPLYLVGILQSDGSFKLDNTTVTSFYTQTLPTTDNGKIYIHIGVMHDTTRYLKLHASHPIYQFKDDKLRLYVPEHNHGNITNDGKIGSSNDLVVVTGADGALTVQSRSGIDSRSTFPPALSVGYGDTVNPYASKTAKYILAAPNAANGVPSFRLLVASDLPAHAANASTYGYGDTTNAGHIRVGAGIDVVTGTISRSKLGSLVTIAADTTLALATHANKTINVTYIATITVPPNSSVAFPIGTEIDFIRTTASDVTFAAGAGVTIRSEGSKLKINAQYQAVTLKKINTDEWVLIGALKS